MRHPAMAPELLAQMPREERAQPVNATTSTQEGTQIDIANAGLRYSVWGIATENPLIINLVELCESDCWTIEA